MAVHYTPLIDTAAANATTFNGPLQELDDAIEDVRDGTLAMSAPQITSFANSAHDHEDAAGGGQLTVDAIDSTGASSGDVPIADGAGAVAWGVIGEAPLGVVLSYAGSTAPTNWLLCDGSAVSRTTYTDLFTLIGTTYGVGDGSTTFNIPDLRGRTVIARDNLGGSSANRVTDANADSLGGTGGAETHTLVESELAAHTHNAGQNSIAPFGAGAGALATTNTQATSSTGGDGAHNNLQPWIALSYIIRAL